MRIDLQSLGVDSERRFPVGLLEGGIALFLLRLKALGAAEAIPCLCVVGGETKNLKGEEEKVKFAFLYARIS